MTQIPPSLVESSPSTKCLLPKVDGQLVDESTCDGSPVEEGLDIAQIRNEMMAKGTGGYVHSYESGSALDGPGLRYVLWLTGCHYKCQYCHNRDTWELESGVWKTLDEILGDIKRYAPFLKVTGGGVTISGGEPLVQHELAKKLLRECKKIGLHTCLDTNGFLHKTLTDSELELVDLVLLDLKSFDPETHLRVTAQPVKPSLEFAIRLSKLQRPCWIRFVLVPGLTDERHNVEGLAKFISYQLDMNNSVERVEILPFHQMGAHKWSDMGKSYPLFEARSPTPAEIEAVKAIFRKYRVSTIV